MNRPRRVRIVTTNDFFASVEPTATSYGRLPGLEGLLAEIRRLREEVDGNAVWIDVGDFSQGGPLATVSGGLGGFRAMAGIGIAAGVLGNHELDWGLDHLEHGRRLLDFPLLAANLSGFQGSAVFELGGVVLGVVGLAPPSMAAFHSELEVEPGPAADLAAGEALRLRREGVDVVIVAVHDGVDYAIRDRRLVPDLRRMGAFCGRLAGVVDGVLGGHTLARHIGTLANIPYAQPWAFGAEVGVIDIPLGPGLPRSFGDLTQSAATPWRGPDAGALARAAESVVGDLGGELRNGPGWDDSLPRFIAAGVLQTVPEAEAAIVFPQELQGMQPPTDGVFAFLAAGAVTDADLMRVIPWSGSALADQVMLADVSPSQFRQLSVWASAEEDAALKRSTWGPPIVVARGIGGAPRTVAISRYFSQLAATLVAPEPIFRATPVRLLDALRARVQSH